MLQRVSDRAWIPEVEYVVTGSTDNSDDDHCDYDFCDDDDCNDAFRNNGNDKADIEYKSNNLEATSEGVHTKTTSGGFLLRTIVPFKLCQC